MFDLIENLCITFATFFRLNVREIFRHDNKKYLTRYYVFRKPYKWMPSIYLHCFHSSDEDLELHNHPWKRSLSFILCGSYFEQRLIGSKVINRILKPGMFNYIRANDFHRIELKSKRVWTLFISGGKVQNWGFLFPDMNKYVSWQDHNKL